MGSKLQRKVSLAHESKAGAQAARADRAHGKGSMLLKVLCVLIWGSRQEEPKAMWPKVFDVC